MINLLEIILDLVAQKQNQLSPVWLPWRFILCRLCCTVIKQLPANGGGARNRTTDVNHHYQ